MMAVITLPDAQEDLLSLQEYMLDKCDVTTWLKAKDEIFEKMESVAAGVSHGRPGPELASVGIFNYQNVFTSHHKLVYRQCDDDLFVHLISGC